MAVSSDWCRKMTWVVRSPRLPPWTRKGQLNSLDNHVYILIHICFPSQTTSLCRFECVYLRGGKGVQLSPIGPVRAGWVHSKSMRNPGSESAGWPQFTTSAMHSPSRTLRPAHTTQSTVFTEIDGKFSSTCIEKKRKGFRGRLPMLMIDGCKASDWGLERIVF